MTLKGRLLIQPHRFSEQLKDPGCLSERYYLLKSCHVQMEFQDVSLLQSSRIRHLIGVFPFISLPFFFVHLPHKRNQVLGMWGGCPARAFGTWSWKGKPWNWTVTAHVKWTGEGTALGSHYDANLREQDTERLHVSLVGETGSYLLASTAHLSLTQATEKTLTKWVFV